MLECCFISSQKIPLPEVLCDKTTCLDQNPLTLSMIRLLSANALPHLFQKLTTGWMPDRLFRNFFNINKKLAGICSFTFTIMSFWTRMLCTSALVTRVFCFWVTVFGSLLSNHYPLVIQWQPSGSSATGNRNKRCWMRYLHHGSLNCCWQMQKHFPSAMELITPQPKTTEADASYHMNTPGSLLEREINYDSCHPGHLRADFGTSTRSTVRTSAGLSKMIILLSSLNSLGSKLVSKQAAITSFHNNSSYTILFPRPSVTSHSPCLTQGETSEH